MDRNEKTELVILWLTTHHLFAEGGYPHDYTTHAGKLFVAELGDSGTEILAFNLDELPGWYDRAVEYLREDPEADSQWPDPDDLDFGYWTEAFYETEPKHG